MSHNEVRVVPADANSSYPVLGETIEGFGAYLLKMDRLQRPEQFHRIRNEARDIIARCRRFDAPDGRETGLVVGYVQSGKTRSMTAVCALARDNGCRIIVILAGVTNILLQQNSRRFREELRAASGVPSAWKIFNSADTLGEGAAHQLRQAVADWRDRRFPETERSTLLFVVLKNHAHLTQLQTVLRAPGNLQGIPALVIDDEADQAGLNTAPDEPEASRTYQEIAAVRASLPHHTYLQYTATPQAPLLIALDDLLSPAFAELVEPGDGYTGGKVFFGEGARRELVDAIPADDLFKPGAPPAVPPESLIAALRVFFVGCAVSRKRRGQVPRSMLVHPSQRTSDHKAYDTWIRAIADRWAATFREGDPADKQDTIDEFRAAYADLIRTDPELPPFEDLVFGIERSVAGVSIKQVNTQDGSEVDWENAEEHILVGGEKLNRGFTIEGLTVTYMPRDAGGWSADTLQQRARFFGYKQKYLSLCRLYLHPDVLGAFASYVRHEEDIRRQLREHRGRPLREWRRAFLLDARMRPTRQNVLSDPYYKVRRKTAWFVQRYPHVDPEAVTRNRQAITKLASRGAWQKNGAFHTHSTVETSLREVYEQFLVTYEVRGIDVPAFYAILVYLAYIIEPDRGARVLLMNMADGEARERTPEAGNSIAVHQGRGSSGSGYPGDAHMRAPDKVTIQIHTLSELVKRRKNGELERPRKFERVPAIAIHIPGKLRPDDVGALGTDSDADETL